MSDWVSVENLADAIATTLTAYQNATYESLMDATNQVGKESVDVLKGAIQGKIEGTGKYIDSLTYKENQYATRTRYTGIIYAKDPHYRLTHLLEHGHLKRNGIGRTRAFPHFQVAEDYASKRMLEVLPQIIERNTK